MAFRAMSKAQYPPRQWALVGHPGAGKSTFAAQMAGPLLVVDADHRFAEVARLAADEVFQLSDEASDNVNTERIAALLKDGMAGSGVKTIVIDSLTSILSPLTTEAIMDNDAGRNKNRVAAFKDKALAMRLLQDSITGWGVDTLWIYHLRTGLDAKAQNKESTSISELEIARLRRSLNVALRVIEQNGKRGIKVEWARCGRQGMTLWDDSGRWQDMPTKIEEAIYAGLTAADQARIAGSTPTSFSGPDEAIAWGWEQGCFRDARHAQSAYYECKQQHKPADAAEMWPAWISEVLKRREGWDAESQSSRKAGQKATEPATVAA